MAPIVFATISISGARITCNSHFRDRSAANTPGRFMTHVITTGVNPSLHIAYKRCRIKPYFKKERALRTETTFNDTYDFGIGRRLSNLSYLRTLGDHMNHRGLPPKGLLKRLDHQKRHVLTPYGRRVALFLTKVHARILRPGRQALDLNFTAQVRPPLRRTFTVLDRAIDAHITEARIAA